MDNIWIFLGATFSWLKGKSWLLNHVIYLRNWYKQSVYFSIFEWWNWHKHQFCRIGYECKSYYSNLSLSQFLRYITWFKSQKIQFNQENVDLVLEGNNIKQSFELYLFYGNQDLDRNSDRNIRCHLHNCHFHCHLQHTIERKCVFEF